MSGIACVRTVLIYGAQLADPYCNQDIIGWQETFREMICVMRSVQAAILP